MLDEKFFTTEQVANILQVHPFTILKFLKQGKLQGIKLGRVYRIKESDVKTFLQERMTSRPSTHSKPKKQKKPEPQPSSPAPKQDSGQESFKIDKAEDQDHYYII